MYTNIVCLTIIINWCTWPVKLKESGIDYKKIATTESSNVSDIIFCFCINYMIYYKYVKLKQHAVIYIVTVVINIKNKTELHLCKIIQCT